jgi:hypothetical protein
MASIHIAPNDFYLLLVIMQEYPSWMSKQRYDMMHDLEWSNQNLKLGLKV